MFVLFFVAVFGDICNMQNCWLICEAGKRSKQFFHSTQNVKIVKMHFCL